jgi:hypothetical protein
MKNKILKRWSILISSVLSFSGIFIGSFACVYGPPGGSEEDFYRMNLLKEEVQKLQDKLNKEESEKSIIQRDLAKYDYEIKKLQREKDSLLILIEIIDK